MVKTGESENKEVRISICDDDQVAIRELKGYIEYCISYCF